MAYLGEGKNGMTDDFDELPSDLQRARIKALEAQLEVMKSKSLMRECNCILNHDMPCEGLLAERKDAERYRYVRTNPAMLLHLSNNDFDAAIDAAMKETGK